MHRAVELSYFLKAITLIKHDIVTWNTYPNQTFPIQSMGWYQQTMETAKGKGRLAGVGQEARGELSSCIQTQSIDPDCHI